MGTVVALLLFLDPLFRPELSPGRDSPQNDLLANLDGEAVYQVAGKGAALMATFIALVQDA